MHKNKEESAKQNAYSRKCAKEENEKSQQFFTYGSRHHRGGDLDPA
jgi:hypothetical protein